MPNKLFSSSAEALGYWAWDKSDCYGQLEKMKNNAYEQIIL